MFAGFRDADPALWCEIALRWWLCELAYFVPAHCREWFARGEVPVLAARWPAEKAAEAACNADFIPLSSDKGTEGLVVLPEEVFYVRSIELPLVSSVALPKIMAFEALRYSPLADDHACFDYRVARRDLAARTMQVDLFFLRQALLTEASRAAKAANVTLCGACIELRGSLLRLPRLVEVGGVRNWVSKRQLRWLRNIGIGVLCGSGLAAIFALRLQAAETVMQRQVDDLRSTFHAAEPSRVALRAMLDEVNTVNDTRRRSTAISALVEITHLLPDSAWLTHLSADADAVRIHGFAKKASGLIDAFAPSKLFRDVRFTGPIVRDGQVNAEQFDLALRLQ